MSNKALTVLTLMLWHAQAAFGAEPMSTTKALDSFAQCFAHAQEQASKSWWFVPSDDGGTFSNQKGQRSENTYFLRVREDEQILRLELESSTPAVKAQIREAIRACA